MDYGFEDQRPTEYRYVDAVATPEVASPEVPANCKWLESHIPYSGESDSYIHWFIRFPKEIS